MWTKNLCNFCEIHLSIEKHNFKFIFGYFIIYLKIITIRILILLYLFTIYYGSSLTKVKIPCSILNIYTITYVKSDFINTIHFVLFINIKE